MLLSCLAAALVSGRYLPKLFSFTLCRRGPIKFQALLKCFSSSSVYVMRSLSLCHQTFFARFHHSLENCQKIESDEKTTTKKKHTNPFSQPREPFYGINASFPHGDTQIVSSSLGSGPPLFVKVNIFTLKKCGSTVSCQGLQRAREGRKKDGGGQKKHFPQYKVLLLFMLSFEMYIHGVCSLGCSAGVNSIFSLQKKVASCGGKEALRGSEVTLLHKC